MQREEAHIACSLNQHNLAWLQSLQAIQSVPTSQGGASKSAAPLGIGVRRGLHKALFFENTVLAQSPIDYTIETGLSGLEINVAVLVALIKEREYFVAFLELSDFGPVSMTSPAPSEPETTGKPQGNGYILYERICVEPSICDQPYTFEIIKSR